MANLKGTFEMKKALIALLFGLLTIPALADNTIVENLQELIETRDAITNAIVERGGTVTSGALKDVPQEILDIPDPPPPSPPVLIDKTITANGTYLASEDNADGYNEVTAAIPVNTLMQTLWATSNSNYVASDYGYDGFKQVNVRIYPTTTTTNFTENGTYTRPNGIDGWRQVTVNVSGGGGSNEVLKAVVSRQASPTWTVSASDLAGVTTIGSYAFNKCSGLTSVTIPDSVTSIGDHAFIMCSGLTSLEIPSSVTYIGGDALYGCSGLKSVTIPDSVTSIGSEAFYNCSGLTSLEIPNSVTSIGNSAFYGCSGLTLVVIGNGVTSIGNGVFYNCSALPSITIPDSVTTFDSRAFQGCNQLATIDFGITRSTIPTLVNVNGFQSLPANYQILVPSALLTDWKAANNWNNSAIVDHIVAHP